MLVHHYVHVHGCCQTRGELYVSLLNTIIRNTVQLSLSSTCRKSVEISLALKQTFEAVIMGELYPHSKIDIYVQVLQSDGGECGHSRLFFLSLFFSLAFSSLSYLR